MTSKPKALRKSSRFHREKRSVIGLGKFRSAVPDLATNKKYLRHFGR